MSAAVSRAVAASIDRMVAEKRRDDAVEDYRVRELLEQVAVAAVPEESKHEYHLGVTNTLSDIQIAYRP